MPIINDGSAFASADNKLHSLAGKHNDNVEHKYANLKLGGQLGIGSHLENIDAATPLALPALVPIVTHVPTFFKDDLADMAVILKTLVERHAKSITGVDFGYTWETGQGVQLHNGQQLEYPTKAVLESISPSIVWPEYTGSVVNDFIATWGKLILDPETQYSALSSILKLGSEDSIDPYVFSTFCMDILFIQFDITFRPENIIDAFLVMNMFPKKTDSYGYKREVNSGYNIPERNIPFAGILKRDQNTYSLGIEIAKALNPSQANYNATKLPVDADYSTSYTTENGESYNIYGELKELFTEEYSNS